MLVKISAFASSRVSGGVRSPAPRPSHKNERERELERQLKALTSFSATDVIASQECLILSPISPLPTPLHTAPPYPTHLIASYPHIVSIPSPPSPPNPIPMVLSPNPVSPSTSPSLPPSSSPSPPSPPSVLIPRPYPLSNPQSGSMWYRHASHPPVEKTINLAQAPMPLAPLPPNNVA